MEILVLAVLLGFIPAAIAAKKGRSFVGWWLFGAMLFIVALPLAIIAKPDEKALTKRGDGRTCPHCAELIKMEAVVCRYCGRDVVDDEEPIRRATRAKPKVASVAPRKTQRRSPTLLSKLGQKADSGDESAMERLTDLAIGQAIEPDDYATWANLAADLRGPLVDETEMSA